MTCLPYPWLAWGQRRQPSWELPLASIASDTQHKRDLTAAPAWNNSYTVTFAAHLVTASSPADERRRVLKHGDRRNAVPSHGRERFMCGASN